MNENSQLLNYKITTDDALLDKDNYITPELKKKLGKLLKIAKTGNLKKVNTFNKLIKEHPKNPNLKNYLYALYAIGGEKEKAYEINQWIVKEHPNYLFGKINMANEYYDKEQFDKIPNVLGKDLEIQMLYPNRNVFHYLEVNSFLLIVIKYYCAIKDFDNAAANLNYLEEIDLDGEQYDEANNIFQYQIAISSMEKMMLEDKNRIKVTHNSKYKYKQIIAEPVFTHQEIKVLYEQDVDIDITIIENILKLPKESLQKDLENVLIDSLSRSDYYLSKYEDSVYNGEELSFVIHALFLLKEIKATSSLPIVLDVLKQDENYIELFLGDYITEYIWMVIFELAKDTLDTLKLFMLQDGINTFSKAAISSVIEQYYQHKIHKKAVVINWYKEIITKFLKTDLEDNLIDSTLNGFIVNELINIHAIELIYLIEQLYNKGQVDLIACGEFDTVKELISIDYIADPQKVASIFEIYNFYSSVGEVDFEEHNDFFSKSDDYYNENEYFGGVVKTIINENKKIGRNDPCPCGSGKKYKKCCLNK